MPKKEVKHGVGGKKAAMTEERLLEQTFKAEDEMAKQKVKMMTEVIAVS